MATLETSPRKPLEIHVEDGRAGEFSFTVLDEEIARDVGKEISLVEKIGGAGPGTCRADEAFAAIRAGGSFLPAAGPRMRKLIKFVEALEASGFSLRGVSLTETTAGKRLECRFARPLSAGAVIEGTGGEVVKK